MADYEFTLPWPPTSNHFHQPIPFKRGNKWLARNITSKEVEAYQVEVRKIMEELMLSGEMIEKPVLINLTLHPKTNHKYDCSNFLKAYEDALVKCGFFEDDHWIEYGSIRKGEKVKGGKIEISVTIIDE